MNGVIVVKIGGSVLGDDTRLASVLDAVASASGPRVLVHGGGAAVTALAQQLGLPQTIVDGRRVTDTDTMRLAAMVYAGFANKTVVAMLQARGCNALGLSGADANVLRARRREPVPIDFGFVGDVDASGVDTAALLSFLEAGLIPVLCAVTHDGHGTLLNSNADAVAAAVAAALSPREQVRLLLCMDREGVLADVSDSGSVIPRLREADAAKLAGAGMITSGMLPKLHAGFAALRAGARGVTVLSARALPAVLQGRPGGGTELVL